jgi:hypothetical protein
MRKMFRAFYRPTDIEFKEMWDTGIFVFDTNVLLHIYRYTPNTSQSFLNLLKGLKDRIWIPHQVGYEFHRGRLDVIKDQHNLYNKLEILLTDFRKRAEDELNKYSRHSSFNKETFFQSLDTVIQQVRADLDVLKQNHPDYTKSDTLLDTILELFDDKVGDPYIQSELNKKYKEAEERYKKKTPPGYKDSDKVRDNKDPYGDAIIWFQIIDHAKKVQKPIIFITDDKKEDWWREHSGETLGPRTELIEEIQREAQVLFYMYSSPQFLQRGNEYLQTQVEEAVTEEVLEVSKQTNKQTPNSSSPSLRFGVPYFSSPAYPNSMIPDVLRNINPNSMIPDVLRSISPNMTAFDIARSISPNMTAFDIARSINNLPTSPLYELGNRIPNIYETRYSLPNPNASDTNSTEDVTKQKKEKNPEDEVEEIQ